MTADKEFRFAPPDWSPDTAREAARAERLTLGPRSYAVVVTRGHKGDAEALGAALARGSRETVILEYVAGTHLRVTVTPCA